MKKISISAFGLLAIVFAITSAFTTAKKPFAVNTWERIGITQDQVSASSPTASAVNTNKIIDAFRLVQGSTISNITSQITAFNNARPDGPNVTCNTGDADQLCAAIIAYRDDTSTELTLLEYT